MVTSIIREHHWNPFKVENLYLDDADFLGLTYWYNDVSKVIKSLKE